MNELFWWYQIILCPLSLSVPDEQTPFYFFLCFFRSLGGVMFWEEIKFLKYTWMQN